MIRKLIDDLFHEIGISFHCSDAEGTDLALKTKGKETANRLLMENRKTLSLMEVKKAAATLGDLVDPSPSLGDAAKRIGASLQKAASQTLVNGTFAGVLSTRSAHFNDACET